MTVKLKTKFKKFAKFAANINDHPKIKFGKFTRRKWSHINSSKSKKLTNYGQILEAKQSLRSFYGNISEKHFRKLYLKGKTSKNNAGLNLIQLLETRLDTILYRIGLSNSLDEVRQFISHKHILVNNNLNTIPSNTKCLSVCVCVCGRAFSTIFPT
jgi:small subunit ribosomal protein S4